MFPLTLTLSLWERGLSERDVGFLPLPVGEGRGEGIRPHCLDFPLTLTLSRRERVLSERDAGFLPLPVGEGIRPQKVSP